MGNCYYCNKTIHETDDKVCLNPLRCIDCNKLNELDKVRLDQKVDYKSQYWLRELSKNFLP